MVEASDPNASGTPSLRGFLGTSIWALGGSQYVHPGVVPGLTGGITYPAWPHHWFLAAAVTDFSKGEENGWTDACMSVLLWEENRRSE